MPPFKGLALGLLICPLDNGQIPDNILNKEDLPQAFGPKTSIFIPFSIFIESSFNKLSPFGVHIST